MIRTALCTAVLSAGALFAAGAGATMFGGEGASCSKPAEAVAVNAEGQTCNKPVEAIAVNAEGQTCNKPVEAVAVNAEGQTCNKPVEAIAANAEGQTCNKPVEAIAANAEGQTCSKPVDAVAVDAEGQACTKPVNAVAVNAEGQACTKPAAAVAVNAEGQTCELACDKPGEAVAVGNPEAEAMPAALFTPVNSECPGSGMPVTDGVTTVVSGFTVGFCCDDCKAAFDANPAAERNAFVAKHVKSTVNENCPGSGMPVAEGNLALYNGFAVGFCCDDCKANWNGAPEAKKVAYIASQHAPENANCPGSGNPINAEVVALYRGHTVGFCCENCQGKFNAMNDDEKTAIVAGFAMGAEASAACEACEAGECDGDCTSDA